MNAHKNAFGALIVILLLSGCAAGPIQVPEKYALQGQLEQVNSFYRQRIIDWEKVDNQSLIIEVSPGTYYLVVLKIPSPELVFRNRIFFSSTGSMVRAGMDDLIVYTEHMKATYPIDRIFKISGTQKMLAVRDQLTGKTDTAQKNAKAVNPPKAKPPGKNSREI